MPLDGVGIKGNANMTKIHGKSSSTSYARRYLMCMIWNIPTQDDDGNAASQAIEFIDEKQLSQIIDYFTELELKPNNKESFYKFMKITKAEEMLKSDFSKAIAALEAARKKKVGK